MNRWMPCKSHHTSLEWMMINQPSPPSRPLVHSLTSCPSDPQTSPPRNGWMVSQEFLQAPENPSLLYLGPVNFFMCHSTSLSTLYAWNIIYKITFSLCLNECRERMNENYTLLRNTTAKSIRFCLWKYVLRSGELGYHDCPVFTPTLVTYSAMLNDRLLSSSWNRMSVSTKISANYGFPHTFHQLLQNFTDWSGIGFTNHSDPGRTLPRIPRSTCQNAKRHLWTGNHLRILWRTRIFPRRLRRITSLIGWALSSRADPTSDKKFLKVPFCALCN